MTENRRRGRPRSEASRRAILQATAELMLEADYESLTVEAIAERGRVGRQTIYRWWPGKASIVAEAVLEGILTPFGVPPSGGTLGELVRALVAQLSIVENAAYVRALTAAAASDAADADALYEHGTRAAHAALADAVRRAGERGEIRAQLDADTVADGLIGALLYRVLTRTPLALDYADELLRPLR